MLNDIFAFLSVPKTIYSETRLLYNVVKRRKSRAKKVTNVSVRLLDEVLKQNEFVLLFIGSTTCPQCRLVAPIVDEISENLQIKCVKTNVDKHYRLAKKYNVSVTPTLIFFEGGHETQSFEGVPTYENLKERILAAMTKEEGDTE